MDRKDSNRAFFDGDFAELINRGALLTATSKGGKFNTMTVSWGGYGTLWGKRVCLVFVRPERYTYEFCEDGDILTLSFFDKDRADTLRLCGTKSGRCVDKIALCDLKFSVDTQGAVTYDDAVATLKLKKLYAQDMQKECFTDTSPLKFYENGSLHRIYICEIIE